MRKSIELFIDINMTLIINDIIAKKDMAKTVKKLIHVFAISPDHRCLTGSVQLFQPFHLRQDFPGFSFILFLILPQKAASFNSAFLFKGFFIRSHLPSYAVTS